jgi:hypothetical protein
MRNIFVGVTAVAAAGAIGLVGLAISHQSRSKPGESVPDSYREELPAERICVGTEFLMFLSGIDRTGRALDPTALVGCKTTISVARVVETVNGWTTVSVSVDGQPNYALLRGGTFVRGTFIMNQPSIFLGLRMLSGKFIPSFAAVTARLGGTAATTPVPPEFRATADAMDQLVRWARNRLEPLTAPIQGGKAGFVVKWPDGAVLDVHNMEIDGQGWCVRGKAELRLSNGTVLGAGTIANSLVAGTGAGVVPVQDWTYVSLGGTLLEAPSGNPIGHYAPLIYDDSGHSHMVFQDDSGRGRELIDGKDEYIYNDDGTRRSLREPDHSSGSAPYSGPRLPTGAEIGALIANVVLSVCMGR